ncbi:MAG: helix-turn-helix domain-containing protein [Crocinitomicaceae bacterium]|nr:helix-turn-helix domain-containing protein [Crocinitomicaceae bacterium]
MIELSFELLSDIASISIALFIGFYFCALAKGNKNANLLIGGFLFYTANSVFLTFSFELGFSHPLITLLSLFDSSFIFAPILLLYAFTLTDSLQRHGKEVRWIILIIVLDFLLEIIQQFYQFNEGFLLSKHLFSLLFNLIILLYLLKYIKFHNNNILSFFSSIDDRKLNWLRLLTIVNALFIVFWLIDDTLSAFIGDNILSQVIAHTSIYATLANIIWIGYGTLRQPHAFEIFKEEAQVIIPEKKHMPPTDERLLEFKIITQQIEEKKLFLDPNITLRELATSLNIKDKELSKLINECSEQNFYHFINAFRIEYFKQLYLSPENDNLSVLGIALESGFKTKSTFYGAFKKIEGQTPKEFLTSQK